jgi:hypothetical protein
MVLKGKGLDRHHRSVVAQELEQGLWVASGTDHWQIQVNIYLYSQNHELAPIKKRVTGIGLKHKNWTVDDRLNTFNLTTLQMFTI